MDDHATAWMGSTVQSENELMPTALKILLIGPRLKAGGSNTGGATRSFEDMIQYFEKMQIQTKVINSQAFKGLTVLLFPFRLLAIVRWSTVVFLNTSTNGIKYLSPIAYVIAKLFKKRIVIRPFGDSLLSAYSSSNFIIRFLISRSALRADILYAQTNTQYDSFRKVAKNVSQLKTGRLSPEYGTSKGEKVKVYSKRFLFVGQVKKSKGIEEILAAKKSLPSSFIVHIYGPIVEKSLKYLESEEYYKGVIDPGEKILEVMKTYDVLLLPTYYQGEGYPGVIVEAYSQGLPVVTTHWKSIPEMVQEGKDGFLIAPGSTSKLVEAMEVFTQENYPEMSDSALKSFRSNFQLQGILEQVVNEIKELDQQ